MFFLLYLQKGDTVGGEKVGPLDGLRLDFADQMQDGVGRKGRGPDQKLINDAAKGPKVRAIVVGLLVDQLGRHIKGRA